MTRVKIGIDVPESGVVGERFVIGLKDKLSNEPGEYSCSSKLLVTSGMGGDFDALKKVLIQNNVIDAKYRWKFEGGHLVVIGNCLTGRAQMIECLWLIYSLEEKALRKVGGVHFILGTQEIDNFNGHCRYRHPAYTASINLSKTVTALYGGNYELWNWLRTKNIMVKIDKLLFVSDNVNLAIGEINQSINEVNNHARACYLQDNQGSDYLRSHQPPLRYDEYCKPMPGSEVVNTILARFGASTVITCSAYSKWLNDCSDKRVINLNGNTEVLMIDNGRFYKMDRKEGIDQECF